MPLKEAALELGEVDELARLAGAGNTLIFDRRRRRVYNTDVGGLVERACRRSGVGRGAGDHPRLRGDGALGAGRRWSGWVWPR